jgi:hypothetical protein
MDVIIRVCELSLGLPDEIFPFVSIWEKFP